MLVRIKHRHAQHEVIEKQSTAKIQRMRMHHAQLRLPAMTA